jgi:hypothetical protein
VETFFWDYRGPYWALLTRSFWRGPSDEVTWNPREEEYVETWSPPRAERRTWDWCFEPVSNHVPRIGQGRWVLGVSCHWIGPCSNVTNHRTSPSGSHPLYFPPPPHACLIQIFTESWLGHLHLVHSHVGTVGRDGRSVCGPLFVWGWVNFYLPDATLSEDLKTVAWDWGVGDRVEWGGVGPCPPPAELGLDRSDSIISTEVLVKIKSTLRLDKSGSKEESTLRIHVEPSLLRM